MEFDNMEITGEITYTFNCDDPNFIKYLEAEFIICDDDRDLLYGMILDYIYANTDLGMASSLYCSVTAGGDLSDIVNEVVPTCGNEWPYFKSLTIKANWNYNDGRFCISDFSLVRLIG